MPFTLRFLLLFITANSFSLVSAQVIKGRVLDQETDSAVAFANVYFNSSLKGTITDVDGKFQLNAAGYEGQEIVISYVGYESLTLRDYSPAKTYKIYLMPSTNMLREIVVEPDDMPRKKKEEIFLREFLGSSPNAKKCKIQNLREVRLMYFKSTKTLLGYADEPLIIRNKALGYTLTYYLDEFKKTPRHMLYNGNFLFKIDSLSNGEEKKISKRRRSTYEGSRMHFIRSLWSIETDDNVFQLYELKTGERIYYLDLKVSNEQQGLKSFYYPGPIRIRYVNQSSILEFEEDHRTVFSENGYFDPQNIYWRGALAADRIGDLLPYEYQPN